MILVDTAVWVDQLHAGDSILAGLLDSGRVLARPFVIGELALGNLSGRETVLSTLSYVPRAIVATNAEVLPFIDRHTCSDAASALSTSICLPPCG